ncbi:MAG: type II toxin-antitoxin system Phd/YefM family antitoxin [Clostridia bacterium]|nr:type II toxin-antitoxin system Phd/YefM family antitoxin [Clostridia bacterium]
MPSIIPVSDLKNYSDVLSHCDDGMPVYLTKNGRGKYVVQSMADYEKQLATIRLLSELSRGVKSLRREGGLTIDEAFKGLGV